MPPQAETAEATCICGTPISACPEGQRADAAIATYLAGSPVKHDVLVTIADHTALKNRALRVAREVHAIRQPTWQTHFPFARVEWWSDRHEEEPPYTTVYIGWEETHRGSTDGYTLIFPVSYLWEPDDKVRELEELAERLRKVGLAETLRRETERETARKEDAERAQYERLKAKFETGEAE